VICARRHQPRRGALAELVSTIAFQKKVFV